MAQAVLTDQQLIEQMEIKLSHLAMRWRERQAQPDAEDIVRQYQAMLRLMIELGFRDELYVDSELPDELMPEEYLTLFES
jgi:hypothetical protein